MVKTKVTPGAKKKEPRVHAAKNTHDEKSATTDSPKKRKTTEFEAPNDAAFVNLADVPDGVPSPEHECYLHTSAVIASGIKKRQKLAMEKVGESAAASRPVSRRSKTKCWQPKMQSRKPNPVDFGTRVVAPLGLWTLEDLARAPLMIMNVQRLCVYLILSSKEVTTGEDGRQRQQAKIEALRSLNALQETLQQVFPEYCGVQVGADFVHNVE